MIILLLKCDKSILLGNVVLFVIHVSLYLVSATYDYIL